MFVKSKEEKQPGILVDLGMKNFTDTCMVLSQITRTFKISYINKCG